MTTRRTFLTQLSRATGAVVLMPAVARCGGATAATPTSLPTAAAPVVADVELAAEVGENLASGVPMTMPENWDPIDFNRVRGNAGAIPESYRGSINGPDGETGHLGKHLPYIPALETETVPEGFVALMWGDPDKGYTRHPNAVRGEANNNEGHWYDSIRLRKATSDEAEEAESTYAEWPGTTEDSTGAYAVFGGGDITDDSGKNTIYLAALPSDVVAGDWVRVHAHCLTHGEYVDFVQV